MKHESFSKKLIVILESPKVAKKTHPQYFREFEIVQVDGVEEGKVFLEHSEQPVDLMIVDYEVMEREEIEFLCWVKERFPRLPILSP